MSEMGPVGTALYPAEHVAKAGAAGAGGMPGVDVRVVTPDGTDLADGEDLTLREVRTFLSTRLAKYNKYKLPRELVLRESLPRNPSGKITKHELREELRSMPA